MAPRIISVANQKGGVGKTTSVLNLAACLAEMGHCVLVIDLDPQANATSGVGLQPSPGTSLYRALLGDGNIADLIVETKFTNLYIIPSELDLAGSEVDVARLDGYLHCFSNILQPIRESDVDFVFVDCPPSLGILTMNALTASDSLLIPMQCEYYALEGLSVISRLLSQLKESGANPGVEIEGILMTMFDGRTNLASEVVSEVRKYFGDKVYSTVIPRNVRLSEAPSHGMPVIHYDKTSTGAAAYMSLAKEFLKRVSAHRVLPQPPAAETAPSADIQEIQQAPAE
jgi:chromosome partitioning protein